MRNKIPPDWDKRIDEKTGEESDRAQIVAEMLLHESDRGCAIFGAAILDDDLEALYRVLFRKDSWSRKHVVDQLFQSYAPLATFSARISLAYAMRLIPKELHRRLNCVRRLRNDFAHESGPIDFQDSRCQDRLRLLIAEGRPRTATDKDDELVVAGVRPFSRRQIVERTAFVIAISVLSAQICFLIESVEKGFDIFAIVGKFDEKGE